MKNLFAIMMVCMLVMSAFTMAYAEEDTENPECIDPETLPVEVLDEYTDVMPETWNPEDEPVEEILDVEERVEIPSLEEVGTPITTPVPEESPADDPGAPSFGGTDAVKEFLLESDAAKTRAFGSAGLVIVFGLLVVWLAPKVRDNNANKKKDN